MLEEAAGAPVALQATGSDDDTSMGGACFMLGE